MRSEEEKFALLLQAEDAVLHFSRAICRDLIGVVGIDERCHVVSNLRALLDTVDINDGRSCNDTEALMCAMEACVSAAERDDVVTSSTTCTRQNESFWHRLDSFVRTGILDDERMRSRYLEGADDSRMRPWMITLLVHHERIRGLFLRAVGGGGREEESRTTPTQRDTPSLA